MTYPCYNCQAELEIEKEDRTNCPECHEDPRYPCELQDCESRAVFGEYYCVRHEDGKPTNEEIETFYDERGEWESNYQRDIGESIKRSMRHHE